VNEITSRSGPQARLPTIVYKSSSLFAGAKRCLLTVTTQSAKPTIFRNETYRSGETSHQVRPPCGDLSPGFGKNSAYGPLFFSYHQIRDDDGIPSHRHGPLQGAISVKSPLVSKIKVVMS
jgi:hypothetical protein